ncbi:MAG: 3-phosphoserine/phosphohydroxythreonine transaminase [Steroidobacteraceae bacterium]
MSRIFNFAAGPAVLPDSVLERIRDDLPDWQGRGMSVMEVSHRGKDFVEVAERAEQSFRRLLGVPAGYKVLFMQGGATAQFAAVPLNLAGVGDTACFLNTGQWSIKAIAEARRYVEVEVLTDEQASNYTTVPEATSIKVPGGAAYLHYTPNETIGGVEFPYVPNPGSALLVADMSSTILSRPIDVSKFALIYAGAQKNIGPSGLTVVVVREDLLGRARKLTPTVLDYAAMAAAGSMPNTPPTFAWYVAGLVFDWIDAGGGLEAMGQRNAAKAGMLYDYLDTSGFYANPVHPGCRSWMNVPFTLHRSELDKQFLLESRTAGLANLEGHRSVGGMRASLYNAMPVEGVKALIEFMQDFAQRHG